MKRAAFIAFEEFAMWQVALLQKFLRDKNWQIDTLTLGGHDVRTDGGITVRADRPMEEAEPNDYQLLLFPGAGGEIRESLLDSNTLKGFIQTFEGPIAASCASALFLASAGKLTGKYTTTEIIKERYDAYFQTGEYTNQDVCVDGGIITSKGFAHFEFMMKVIELLGLSDEDPSLQRVALKLARNN